MGRTCLLLPPLQVSNRGGEWTVCLRSNEVERFGYGSESVEREKLLRARATLAWVLRMKVERCNLCTLPLAANYFEVNIKGPLLPHTSPLSPIHVSSRT